MSILSSKLFLISAGVVSLAVGFKFYVPFTVDEIPLIWSVIMSWLKPPYLYVIINAIIVVIIVSSRFHWSPSESLSVRSEHLISVKTPPPAYYESLSSQPEIASVVQESMAAVVYDSEDRTAVEAVKSVVVMNGSRVVSETDGAHAKDILAAHSVLADEPPPQEMVSLPPELPLEFLLPVREKPLVSSRFGHRKPIRTTPEGMRALRVAKPKRHETLESTWKMITEGRHVPLTRHAKKSDAWEHHAATSDNFQELTSYHPAAAAAARIRKEPSLGQDELNRRVEAFIKKFNEDMRMQRQESLNQYKEMMQRGL